jgi:hypothetical protein
LNYPPRHVATDTTGILNGIMVYTSRDVTAILAIPILIAIFISWDRKMLKNPLIMTISLFFSLRVSWHGTRSLETRADNS